MRLRQRQRQRESGINRGRMEGGREKEKKYGGREMD